MPRVSVVAKNYAKALFFAAKKGNKLEGTMSELEVFKKSFSVSFAQELKNPVISKDELNRIIEDVTDRFGLSRLNSNFFASIVKNRRLHLFPEIYEEFLRLVKIQNNILSVELIVAQKIQDRHMEKIRSVIEKKYPEKKIAIKEVVDEKILGGFQVRIGSGMLDVSLKNQLESLGKKLLGQSS